MEFQEIPENPNFNTEVRKIEENTLVHADIMNEFLSTLIQNDTFLKNLANTIMENVHATYQQSTGYTDKKISELINGAPTTLDTLKEVADAIQNNQTVVEALDAAIGTKAAKVEFDSHEGNGSIHITPDEKQAIRNNTSQNISFSNSLNDLNTNLRNNWVDIKSVTATAGVDIHRALYNMITKEVIIDAYGDVPVGNGNPILQYMKHTPSVEIKYFFCGMGKWNGDLTVNDWFPVVCTVNTGGQVMPWYPLNSVATHLRLKIHYICM